MELSEYELLALRQIADWKDRAVPSGRRGLRLPDRFVPRVPVPDPLRKAVGLAAQGVLEAANAAAQTNLRHEPALARVRAAGHHVESLDDLILVDLSVLDRTLDPVPRRFVLSAMAEGAAAGSLPALAGGAVMAAQTAAFAADTALLLGASLRVVGEILTHYGVDVRQRHEQAFAAQVLELAAGPGGARPALIQRLSRLSRDFTRHQTWTELEEQAAARATQELVRWVAFRLAQRKVAQLVPVAGGIVGAGANGAYMSQAVEAAKYMGRDRFLIRKQEA